jgi:ribA/ribD-fused uncharacterized protein
MTRHNKRNLSEPNKSISNSEDAQGATDEIKFYRANEKPYGVFSNLFKCQLVFQGVSYPTAEHAYQAGKAIKPAVRDWILAAPSPALAAMAAHGLYVWDVVPNWAQIKFDRMRGVLHAKFTQNSDLADLLISTGKSRLVEAGTVNNAVNRLWGEVDGKGENMLGVMLMELREELIRQRNEADRVIAKKAAPSGAQPRTSKVKSAVERHV